MMMRQFGILALLAGVLALPLRAAETGPVEFEPKVGNTGVKVTLKSPVAKDAVIRFGTSSVMVFRDETGTWFIVPPGAPSSFIQIEEKGKSARRSAVPFVVAGPSMAPPPKLIGLKEAIDVFGYSDPVPEGGVTPEKTVRPIWTIGEDEILTMGEPPLQRMGPAVEPVDLNALSRGPLGQGFMITARPPKPKKPTPTPVPAN
jgi:hypothetical protein